MSSPQNNQSRVKSVLPGSEIKQSEQVRDTDTQLITHANQVLTAINLEEACLHFGIRTDDNNNASNGVAKVYMSLPAFKRFIGSAAALLQAVEAAVGAPIDANPNQKLNNPEATQKMKDFMERKNQQAKERNVSHD